MKQFSTRLGARLIIGAVTAALAFTASPATAAPASSESSLTVSTSPLAVAEDTLAAVSIAGGLARSLDATSSSADDKAAQQKAKKAAKKEAKKKARAKAKAKKKAAAKAKKKARAKAKKRLGVRAMKVASAQAGDPYVYGAAGPDAFDCSGLTSYSFKRAGKTIPRTSSAQRGAARHVKAKHRRVGDLVFFHGSSGVYHVGIYAGKNRIWHAPSTGRTVTRENIWTSSVSYGRVG